MYLVFHFFIARTDNVFYIIDNVVIMQFVFYFCNTLRYDYHEKYTFLFNKL